MNKERRHTLSVAIIAAVVTGLVAFWIWAAPEILRSTSTRPSLFAIFKMGFEQAKREVAGQAPFARKERADILQLSPEQADAITDKIKAGVQEGMPKLPEAGDKNQEKNIKK